MLWVTPRRASGLQPRTYPNGRASPYRGDPYKAQGAQPCKGDQTLGKPQQIIQSPAGGLGSGRDAIELDIRCCKA